MSAHSKIEWTDATWNPIRGCTKISPGCMHCYAETFAERFRGVPGHPYEQGFDVRLIPSKLADPFLWTAPRMVFVNSMSDLFHEGIEEGYIEQACRVMEQTPWHTYQILTKRSGRMLDLLRGPLAFIARAPNVWFGVSVENRKHGFPRVEHLRNASVTLRMLSVEPLLEDLGTLDLEGIGWVILGGESGPGARSMEPDWVRSVRDQCATSRVPFFFKQWGGTRKGKTGRELDGVTHDEAPSRSNAPFPTIGERRRSAAYFRELSASHFDSDRDEVGPTI